MTSFMNIPKQLIEDLESSNLDNKIEAIQYIGAEFHYKELVPRLLYMLSNEQNINVLNALALCLGRLGINEAVHILIRYIRDPNLKNKRGSFIYAMVDLDCREYFLDFVKMICDGDFEVCSHSFLVFESIVDEANYNQRFEAIDILEYQKSIEIEKGKSEYPQFERTNYINEALEILRSLI